MNNLLIATFHSESSARAAMKIIDDMAFNGEIDLYERVLIRKTVDGRTQVFKGDVSAEWQTLAGATFGSLIGLFGGPVGLVIGMLAGGALGSAIADLRQYDFGRTFLRNVRFKAPVGTVSIIAHVGERGRDLVDSALHNLGAEISRTTIDPEDVSTAEISTVDADIGSRVHSQHEKFEKDIDKRFGPPAGVDLG